MMAGGKRKKRVILLIVLALILLLPIPMYQKDGGTVDLYAVLYSCRIWHRINPAQDSNPAAPAYLTGVDFALFPFNFMKGLPENPPGTDEGGI